MNEFKTEVGAENIEKRVSMERQFVQLKNLIADVKDYAQEHHPNTQLGRALAQTIIQTVDPVDSQKSIEEIQAGVHAENTVSAQAEFIPLVTKNKEALDSFGLFVSRPHSYLDPYETYDGAAFNIKNIDSFLKNVDAISLVAGTYSSETFKKLLDDIKSQVFFNNVEETTEPIKELNERLVQIVDVLHKVAPQYDFKELDAYSKFSKLGRLKNYITVEREYLWAEAGHGFGPADWVRDISPEDLEKKWSNALNILRLQEMEEGIGVAVELRDHLLKCITIAYETVNTLQYLENYKDHFNPVLLKYTQALIGNKSVN